LNSSNGLHFSQFNNNSCPKILSSEEIINQTFFLRLILLLTINNTKISSLTSKKQEAIYSSYSKSDSLASTEQHEDLFKEYLSRKFRLSFTLKFCDWRISEL